jgi:hypothetical protein
MEATLWSGIKRNILSNVCLNTSRDLKNEYKSDVFPLRGAPQNRVVLWLLRKDVSS